MQHNLVQKVGNDVYHAQYAVEGNKLTVTLDGVSKEEEISWRPAEYQARDLVREIVRDKAKH